jgi:cytochrome c biogenesis protein CcdA
MQNILPIISVAAFIDSINPCAISVLLLTIAFLFSLEQMQTRSKILKIGGLYIFGIFLVYLLIGLGLLQALSIFNVPHFMAKAGATLVIMLGIIGLAENYCPSFPIKFGLPKFIKPRLAKLMEKSSAPAALVLGGMVGLFEFPCTGGPYLMVLGLLHDKATFAKGFTYLIWYNFVFVLPLIVILLIAGNKTVLAKIQAWKKKESSSMNFWASIAMIALGIMIFLL